MRATLGVALCALLVASTAHAASLEDLAFLVGHWKGDALGGTVEEVWLPAAGNTQHAVFRATSDGAMSFSEFIQVTEEDGEVIMRFEHFRPDYSTWEGDGPPMTLRLVEVGPSHAFFEGMNDDTPSRIEYVLVDDRLSASVTGIGKPIEFRRLR